MPNSLAGSIRVPLFLMLVYAAVVSTPLAEVSGVDDTSASPDNDVFICGTDTLDVEDRQVLIEVGLVSDDSVRQLLPNGCTLVHGALLDGVAATRVDDTLDYCDYLDSLGNSSGVVSAIPNIVLRIMAIPNDPFFPTEGNDTAQWHLRNLGDVNGNGWLRGADIAASAAWDITTGDPGVVTMIFDLGIPFAYDSAADTGYLVHPDLDDTARIWPDTNFASHKHINWGGGAHNLQEFACSQYSWTKVHGSKTACVISSEPNNDTGLTGIVWNGRLRVEKGNSFDHVNKSIQRGRAFGDAVYSLSMGSTDPQPAEVYESAERNIDSALTDDLLIVVSAGNDSNMAFQTPAIFASWGTLTGHAGGYRNVMAIGATTWRDSIAYFSSRSMDSARVTLCAPGRYIQVLFDCTPTYPTFKGYQVSSGTSFAAPIVAGVASLVKARYPTIGADSLRSILENTADKIWQDPRKPAYADTVVDGVNYKDSVWHPWYGHGRVNAFRALGGKTGTLATQAWSWTDPATDTVWLSESTIPSGDTVTVSGDVIIKFSRDDLKVSGLDSTLSELVVEGRLEINGSAVSHAKLIPAAAYDEPAWYGIHVKAGGSLKIHYADIYNAKVAITVDSGGVVDTIIGCNVVDCQTGIEVHSGTLAMRNVAITGALNYGIDALDGNAVVRLYDSVYISGTADTTVGVGVDTTAKLVANSTVVEDGYIGFEIQGSSVDSLLYCRSLNNTLCGIRFIGTGPDYSYGNYVESDDTASATDWGINVYKQSIESSYDTVMGGYNWDYNFYSATNSGVTADIFELYVSGKAGDEWGLVLNGPSSTGDTARVVDAEVVERFTAGHLYMRYLHAEVEGCRFNSTGVASTASPYGIKDMGSTSGKVRCTESADHASYCVYRNGFSSLEWGNSLVSQTGSNAFYVSDTDSLSSTDYFWNAGFTSVTVENTYWGSNPPDTARLKGAIDYTPYLTSVPGCVGSGGGGQKLAADDGIVPSRFALQQNYPNPFNPTTTIQFALPVTQPVTIDIFNILGQKVRTFELGAVSAGYGQVTWDGTNRNGRSVGTGLYFYRMTTPGFTETKKMLLLK